MSEENKRLVREITAVVWNSRGLDRIPEFYAPDVVADYRPYAPLREGHEGIRGMVERAWTAFPDYHEELHELIAEATGSSAASPTPERKPASGVFCRQPEGTLSSMRS